MSIRHPVSYNTYYMKHIDMNIIHIILISKILTSCPCCIYHTMDASRPKFPTTDPQCTYYIYISTNPSSHIYINKSVVTYIYQQISRHIYISTNQSSHNTHITYIYQQIRRHMRPTSDVTSGLSKDQKALFIGYNTLYI